MKALTAAPHGFPAHLMPEARWAPQHVMGPWRGIQQDIADRIAENAWEHGGPRGIYPGDRADELLVDLDPDRPGVDRWARVRVHVEILDGLP